MIDKKMLMVVDSDPQSLPNQPFFNVMKYFSGKFQEIHFASYTNLYGGPPVPLQEKIKKSFHNLLYDRYRVSQEGNFKYLVTRRLKLPHALQIMLGDLWLIVNLPSWIRESHYDICFYSHPSHSLLVKWLQKSRIVSKVVYYDIDFYPDHIEASDPLSSRLLSWRERIAVTNADGVISVSKPLARLRKSQGAKKIIVVPNGVVVDYFVEARQKEPHPPTLIYVGLLSEAWGIDLVLEALPLIKRQVPDIKFILVGFGAYLDELRRMTSRLGLDDMVTFLGKKPYNEIGKCMRLADVGVAVYKSRKFVEYASPMKIKDYLAAGLPVITTRVGEAEEIIRDSGAGELVDCLPTSIASAAIRILGNKQLADEYTRAAIRYAPRLDWSAVLEPALEFIVSL